MSTFHSDRSFVAIIGDIRGSRSLTQRREIQENLGIILQEINEGFEADIAAKFLITLGDEFQGLLFDGRSLLKIIEKIKMSLYPVTFRFGIGMGQITTNIFSEMALGADGPAFYRARSAIELLKENESKKKAVLSDLSFRFEEKSSTTERLLNTAFTLLYSLEHTWTDRKASALRLGITQSAVHKALSAGSYYTYEKALKEITSVMEEISI